MRTISVLVTNWSVTRHSLLGLTGWRGKAWLKRRFVAGPKSGITLTKGLLKALRIAARVTQEDLAAGSGLSPSTVTRAEPGKTIDINTAAALSAALSQALGRTIDLADPPDVAQLQRQLVEPRYLSPLLELERTIHGRSEQIDAIRRSLERHLVATLTPSSVLTGAGGIGKTAMARLYASSSTSRYAGIWWLPSATRSLLLEGYRQLADRIGLPTPGDDAAIARRTIRQIEESGKPWLPIFDNVSSPSLLAGFMPTGRHVHRIVTSRLRSWGRNFERIEIDVLGFATAESQVYNWPLFTSCRSIAPPTDPTGPKASRRIASFCSTLQRRRPDTRPTISI